MAETPPFLREPDGTREAIMAATYHALCAHGYAGLTIQRIAAEFEKSKSLLYHHYDDKDDLLLEFLAYMLDQFESQVPADDTDDPSDDPGERLDCILDRMFPTTVSDEQRNFGPALVELRAQAAHDERYRTQFSKHDDSFKARLVEVIDAGIETGEFRDVDAEAVAETVLTTIVGSMTRRVTANDTYTAAVRDELDSYLDRVLHTDD